MEERKFSLSKLVHGKAFWLKTDVIRFNTYRCVYASGLKARIIQDRNGNFYGRVIQMTDEYFDVNLPIFGQPHQFRVYFQMCITN